MEKQVDTPRQSNNRIVAGTIVLLAVLLAVACNPITGEDVIQGSDTLSPVITNRSPANGST